MSELWRSLTQGGSWTPRERLIGLWVRRVIVVVTVLGVMGWNFHMQRRGAENLVWTEWVNEQCQAGDESRCMSYASFSDKSGMPNSRFWTQNPQQQQLAQCIELKGWMLLNPIQEVDYSRLADRCR